MPLDEALSRAVQVYEKEQRHPAPTDAVARDIGYKSANSGAALSAIATLRAFGLLERTEPGKLAVSAEVQSYRYAPDENLKKELLVKWLRSPPIFAQLLDKYQGGLPSDATIHFDLIEEGFKPGSAQTTLNVLKRSVEFVDYYDSAKPTVPPIEPSDRGEAIGATSPPDPQASSERVDGEVDRIPVRLDAKRRAWLEIPTPFYEEDKQRLKAQIDLLLTDGKEGEIGG